MGSASNTAAKALVWMQWSGVRGPRVASSSQLARLANPTASGELSRVSNIGAANSAAAA